jgi:hypothetical protein
MAASGFYLSGNGTTADAAAGHLGDRIHKSLGKADCDPIQRRTRQRGGLSLPWVYRRHARQRARHDDLARSEQRINRAAPQQLDEVAQGRDSGREGGNLAPGSENAA